MLTDGAANTAHFLVTTQVSGVILDIQSAVGILTTVTMKGTKYMYETFVLLCANYVQRTQMQFPASVHLSTALFSKKTGRKD